MTLNELNYLSSDDAMKWFEQTCAASNWCKKMTVARPFSSLNSLEDAARRAWKQMQTDDWLEAFKAHPMIGDLSTLREKYKNTQGVAANEQSSTETADDATLQALATNNQAYLKKHGFIFIICATGLSANTMLQQLENRLPNDTATEMKNAAEQQLNITLLRLKKGLNSEGKQ